MAGMDPGADARDLVTELFPQARWALLSRGVLTARRTPTSDLDIMMMLDRPPAAVPRVDALAVLAS